MRQQDFALRPWQISTALHSIIMVALALLTLLKPKPGHESYEVAVQVKEPESPQALLEMKKQNKVVLKSINQKKTQTATTQGREIFGISRHSYTDQAQEGVEVRAKLGNTLTKTVDNEKLETTDPDALPAPTEEYLVSQMPTLITEFKPAYPREAKEKQFEGAVTMSILIDEKGLVRQADIIDGPEIFRATALEAIRKFVFGPAKVDGKAVAVKIRYVLRFKLEF
ncbi:MAG: energy transducer TonB [Bdellovibrio sp.]|nr:energy transducer TonB [Bdellovibrio sp.]